MLHFVFFFFFKPKGCVTSRDEISPASLALRALSRLE